MWKPGTYYDLDVLRDTSVGLFLGNEEGDEVLLPNKYIPKDLKEGEKIHVFVYLDHEERPVATTKKPKLGLNEFALLKVSALTHFGAFMNWGMEKELLVPFREQHEEFHAGKRYVVQLRFDEESERLYGTNRIDRHLSNEQLDFKEGDEVECMIYRKTDLGYLAIVQGVNKGLFYHNEVFSPLNPGYKVTAFVKKITDDNKVDLSLQPLGFTKSNDVNVDKILSELVNREGKLPLGDKSEPEEIVENLNMSKKAFKRAIGSLYKEKRITISAHQIELTEQN